MADTNHPAERPERTATPAELASERDKAEHAAALRHDGWNSGTCPRPPASSAQLLELERAADKAADMLRRLDDLSAARGCPYTLGCLEVITRTLITAAEAVTGQ